MATNGNAVGCEREEGLKGRKDEQGEGMRKRVWGALMTVLVSWGQELGVLMTTIIGHRQGERNLIGGMYFRDSSRRRGKRKKSYK